MADEKKKASIEVKDLEPDEMISEEELKKVKGGAVAIVDKTSLAGKRTIHELDELSSSLNIKSRPSTDL